MQYGGGGGAAAFCDGFDKNRDGDGLDAGGDVLYFTTSR
jgi:hypothetical protein